MQSLICETERRRAGINVPNEINEMFRIKGSFFANDCKNLVRKYKCNSVKTIALNEKIINSIYKKKKELARRRYLRLE